MTRSPECRSRRIFIGVAVFVVIVIIDPTSASVLRLSRRDQVTNGFQSTFIKRCEEFKGSDCQDIWEAFSQAYVGRDPCTVAMEDYDPLVAAASLQPACSRTLFWSKTKDFVSDFAASTSTIPLEHTLLGHTLNDLTWCGEEGSDETFMSGCPDRRRCENSPVSSFWKRASAAFAEAACGDVTVLLNGDIDTPFDPTSIFGSIEIKRLSSSKVSSMKVVLVSKNNPRTNCSNPSLENLRDALDPGINYSCQSNGHKYFASVLVYLLLMGQFFL